MPHGTGKSLSAAFGSNMSTVYGYIRVSSQDQNDSRQLLAMQEQGIPPERLFTDRMSGKDFCRPQYMKMLRRLQPGDQLCVKSIDRLGRNYEEILEQWRLLTHEKGVGIYVLDMPLLDTRSNKDLLGTFIADVVLQVLSFVAHNERESIRKRQAEGIAAAKLRGVRFGREAKPLPPLFHDACRKWIEGRISASEAARQCCMPRSTFCYKARQVKDAV